MRNHLPSAIAALICVIAIAAWSQAPVTWWPVMAIVTCMAVVMIAKIWQDIIGTTTTEEI